MQLEHTFTVPADIDTVWQAVLDPERVAPCMPGATLTTVEGTTFSGQVKVKVGPISLLYKGSGEFIEQDAVARRLVMKASGKDTRGNGTAAATVTVVLSEDGSRTTGAVTTDLSITGKPAQFGRGLIAEVGGKILDAFAECLAGKLGPAGSSESAPAAGPVTQSAPQAAPAELEPAATGAMAAARPQLALVDPETAVQPQAEPVAAGEQGKPTLSAVPAEQEQSAPDSEPIDLLAFAGPSVLKRAAPVLAALIAIVVFIALRRRSG